MARPKTEYTQRDIDTIAALYYEQNGDGWKYAGWPSLAKAISKAIGKQISHMGAKRLIQDDLNWKRDASSAPSDQYREAICRAAQPLIETGCVHPALQVQENKDIINQILSEANVILGQTSKTAQILLSDITRTTAIEERELLAVRGDQVAENQIFVNFSRLRAELASKNATFLRVYLETIEKIGVRLLVPEEEDPEKKADSTIKFEITLLDPAKIRKESE